MKFKEFIAGRCVGERLKFECNCVVLPINTDGEIVGWEIVGGEIVFDVRLDGGKRVSIGENHPGMNVILKN